MKCFQLFAKGFYANFNGSGKMYSKEIYLDKEDITVEVKEKFKVTVSTPMTEDDFYYLSENKLTIIVVELDLKVEDIFVSIFRKYSTEEQIQKGIREMSTDDISNRLKYLAKLKETIEIEQSLLQRRLDYLSFDKL